MFKGRKGGGGALHESKQQGLAYSTAIKVNTSTKGIATQAAEIEFKRRVLLLYLRLYKLTGIYGNVWHCWCRS